MATAQTKPPENAMLSEEAQLAQKYGGAIKKPGMNNILQKRLNKGQKYFDSGDYNMAKAKTPGVPKAAQPSTQSGIPASTEQPQAEESQPPPTAEPTAATEVDVQQASAVSGPAESVPPAEPNAEAATKTDSTDEQQRSYPRKAVPAASPLTKPPTPNASGVPTPDGAPVGGIPHPRALTVHLAHPTHTGPFVTHPERSSPSAETPPVAVGADGERRTSASHSHDVPAEQI